MTALFALMLLAGAPQIPQLDWQPRSDWLSVAADGAVGDGKADDTAALQRAFARFRDGTVVYLPAGTYRVTAPLVIRGPLTGILLIGHGRATRLVWDGPAGGNVIVVDGIANSRLVGLDLDGGGKAAVGIEHFADHRFETEVRHQHLAFHNFTAAGLRRNPQAKFSLAETAIENCWFDHCAVGVSFTQFNDYDYTFDGCEFNDCGVGIECNHGNLYARDSHFERSTRADILLAPEHGSSVRRCTSLGSQRFLEYGNPVAPISVEHCAVANWGAADGAVVLGGAPVMLFDCRFSGGQGAPVNVRRGGQHLVLSGNQPADPLPAGHAAKVYRVPRPAPPADAITPDRRFLRDTAVVPSAVFDAHRDFGAKGDGQADDTAALRRTIAAAKAQGHGALAYLPTGHYVLSETLELTGGDYAVGGSGFRSSVVWKGAAGGTMLHVADPQDLRLEHIAIGNHDSGQMDNAIDVLQTSTGQPSRMTYDNVSVFGMYQKQPERKGLWLRGLGPGSVVNLPHLQGNLHVVGSAAATILGSITYEGTLTLAGAGGRRDGFLGFMTRLGTLMTLGLRIRDSHSVVMSDFYVEQADNGFVFEGQPTDPPGRVTIQGAKLQFNKTPRGDLDNIVAQIDGYHGAIAIGHHQSYIEPATVRYRHTSGDCDLLLWGYACYNTRLDVVMAPDGRLHRLGCEGMGDAAKLGGLEDTAPESALPLAARALDDLRRLGEFDLRLNHGL